MADAVTIDALTARFGRAGAVAFACSPLGGIVAKLHGPAGAVTVALDGGQVLRWLAPDGRDVLWLSPVARLGTGKAVRGGIPVCWPWFGPVPPGAPPSSGPWPQHGLVRTKRWQLEASTAGDATVLELATGVDEATSPHWGHSAAVRLIVRVDEALTLTLETRNTGSRTMLLTQALHTYFRVGDVGLVQVLGLDGLAYEEMAAVPASPTLLRQDGALGIGREVDRIYTGHAGRAVLIDASLSRSIAIDKAGSLSTIVWNPWIEKSRRLGDMDGPGSPGPVEYRRLLCIETANTRHDVVTLAPDGTCSLGATYRVTPL